jgi:hypothetical protein
MNTLGILLSNFATSVGNTLRNIRLALEAKIGNTAALVTTNKDLAGAVNEVHGLATGPVSTNRLDGLIDPANMPVQKILGVYKSTALSIATLSVADQAQLSTNGANNTFNGLRLAGGQVYIYDGGDKTDEMSFTPIADHTPSWGLVEDKPTSFPSTIGEVAGLSNALGNKVESSLLGDLDINLVDIFNTALAA